LFLFLLLILWVFETKFQLNLYFIFLILIPIVIYTFFTKNFKSNYITFSLLLLLWGFVIQSLSIYGFLIYANKNSIVYLLFIINT
jgi:hypothetical protein